MNRKVFEVPGCPRAAESCSSNRILSRSSRLSIVALGTDESGSTAHHHEARSCLGELSWVDSGLRQLLYCLLELVAGSVLVQSTRH